MKSTIIYLITATAFFTLFFSSCAKDTMEAEEFGDIEGIVINGETEEGVATVNITTTPATNAIFTENDGTFTISNIPTGNYTIQARKKDFSNNSVTVAVREGQMATARIALNPDEEDTKASEEDFRAEVTSWFNDVDGDSTFVDVNYRVSNISSEAEVDEYEVYFEIETSGGTSFFYDVKGDSLQPGQNRNGNFRQYIRNNEATSVIITDVWISE